MNLGHPLCFPKILKPIGSYLSLFERRFEAPRYRFVNMWNPKPLLRAASTCQAWCLVLTPIIWETYDLAMMEKVPKIVLGRNIHHVRNLSLLDKTHKHHEALWDALQGHGHIEKLEIHDAMFPVKKLLGPTNHNLGELKLSGNCERMHPFLTIFVEKQVHLKVLELERFKFTASDWKRIISNKPHLRKLAISQQCDFTDHKSDGDEHVNMEAMDSTPGMYNTATGNHPSVTYNWGHCHRGKIPQEAPLEHGKYLALMLSISWIHRRVSPIIISSFYSFVVFFFIS
ncbi:MAG: hypothetical protein JOS17DRAFT_769666 [Linnemannia elongata]|nr:MAG: hypothetical protein JOS17DRAFT_769666 [Linnemannia elongata]